MVGHGNTVIGIIIHIYCRGDRLQKAVFINAGQNEAYVSVTASISCVIRSSVFVSQFFLGLPNLLTPVSVSIQFYVPNERQRSLCLCIIPYICEIGMSISFFR